MSRNDLKTLAAITVCTCVVLFAADALACGAMTPVIPESDTVEPELSMKAQEALIVERAEEVDVHLQVTATSNVEEFAWFFPVPPDASLSLGDPALFDELAVITQPTVTVQEPRIDNSGSGGVGCGGAEPGSSQPGGSSSDTVERVDGGQLGDYEYEIVATSSAADLETWLDDNGYETPDGTERALAHYISAGMHFAGVKLAGSDTSQPSRPDTLVVTMPRGESLMYPLALSQLSAPTTSEIAIYLLAEHRMTTPTYETVEITRVAREMGELFDTSQEVRYDTGMDRLNQEAGELVESEVTYTIGQNESAPAGLFLVLLGLLLARVAPRRE